jgi:hypothetical protein
MTKYSTTYLIAAYALVGAAVVFMTLAMPVAYVARKVSKSNRSKP